MHSHATCSRGPRRRRVIGVLAAGLGWPWAAADVSPATAAAPARRALPPPSATLDYALRRGMLSGSGEMRWQRRDDRYELSLEGSVAGFPVLRQVSRGGLDAGGLAPDTFVDKRLRRPARIATFERDQGRVVFSAAPDTYPIVPGMQDRLSWMIQLAALAEAEPLGLRAAGVRVPMFVVGARGDGELWEFEYERMEAVRGQDAPAQAARFTRRPRKPDDSEVDVWLDPARHWLPVFARIGDGDADPPLELRLRELRLP